MPLTVLAALLLAAPALAQSASDTLDAPPRFVGRANVIVAGLGGSLLLPEAGFGREIGGRHGGGRAFFGAQATPRLAFGLDVASYRVSAHEETVTLPSGPQLEVETSTDVARIGVFGRYGPRVGPIHAYGEALVGITVVMTQTALAGRSEADAPAETQRTDAAPSAGLGAGAEYEFRELPVAVHVRAQYVRGGTARFLIFDPEAGAFTERTSGTSAGSLTVGLTYNFFRARPLDP